MLAKVDLNIVDPVEPITFHISLAQIMSDMVCVVTGSKTYKYMKLEDKFHSFRAMHTQLFPHGRDNISEEYTCHAWAKNTVQLVVGTDRGEILVCAMSGEFLIYVPDSPRGKRIDSIQPYSQGLVLGGEAGKIWVYKGSEDENQVYEPFQKLWSGNRDHPKSHAMQIEPENITQMCITPEEDVLYYIDRNNQLLKTYMTFDGSDEAHWPSEYVQGVFHNEPIKGMDISLRKKTIVTCSANYVCVWNWGDKK